MEEVELIREAKLGNQKAMTELFGLHRGLLVYYANRESPESPLDFDDVYSLGCEAFMEAIYSFDETRGQSFGKWLGCHLYYLVRDAWYEAKNQGLPAPTRVIRRGAAIDAGYAEPDGTLSDARAMQHQCTKVISGDAGYGDSGDTLFSKVGKEHAELFLDTAKVWDAVSKLPTKERKVMELVLAFDGTNWDGEANMALIADSLGVGRERVRQLKGDALWHLRKMFNVRGVDIETNERLLNCKRARRRGK